MELTPAWPSGAHFATLSVSRWQLPEIWKVTFGRACWGSALYRVLLGAERMGGGGTSGPKPEDGVANKSVVEAKRTLWVALSCSSRSAPKCRNPASRPTATTAFTRAWAVTWPASHGTIEAPLGVAAPALHQEGHPVCCLCWGRGRMTMMATVFRERSERALSPSLRSNMGVENTASPATENLARIGPPRAWD